MHMTTSFKTDAFGITQLPAAAHESSAQAAPSHYLFAHGAATDRSDETTQPNMAILAIDSTR
jgi:hypothetical protein